MWLLTYTHCAVCARKPSVNKCTSLINYCHSSESQENDPTAVIKLDLMILMSAKLSYMSVDKQMKNPDKNKPIQPISVCCYGLNTIFQLGLS